VRFLFCIRVSSIASFWLGVVLSSRVHFLRGCVFYLILLWFIRFGYKSGMRLLKVGKVVVLLLCAAIGVAVIMPTDDEFSSYIYAGYKSALGC
jgi:hypothetical protein